MTILLKALRLNTAEAEGGDSDLYTDTIDKMINGVQGTFHVTPKLVVYKIRIYYNIIDT